VRVALGPGAGAAPSRAREAVVVEDERNPLRELVVRLGGQKLLAVHDAEALDRERRRDDRQSA